MYNSVKQTKVQLSKDIFPVEAWELISNNREDDDLVIIDVSTPQEYKDLHLEGAINVNLLSRFFKSRLDVMNKNKTYVAYCKVGGRSKIAQKLGFRTGLVLAIQTVNKSALQIRHWIYSRSGMLLAR